MTLERHDGIVARHPRSVIADANTLTAAVFDRHVDGRRAGVECVLDQLLHHRRRTLDDFTGRDLVGDGAGEDCDA